MGDNLLPWIFDIDINSKQDTKARHGELWSWTWLIETIGWIGGFGFSKGDLTISSWTLVKDQGNVIKSERSEISNIWVGYFDQSNESNMDKIGWLFIDTRKYVENNGYLEMKYGAMYLVDYFR